MPFAGFLEPLIGNLLVASGTAASWPLSDRLSLFARGGAYFRDGDAEFNDLTAATPEDTNIYIGGGVRFVLNERWSPTAGATRYDLDGTASTVASAGVEIAF